MTHVLSETPFSLVLDGVPVAPTLDVETAGRLFGIGRTTAYALARAGEFPCELIRVGRAYRVVTADLLRVLNITRKSDGPGPSRPEPSDEHAPLTTSAN